jgi:hypothetical protein
MNITFPFFKGLIMQINRQCFRCEKNLKSTKPLNDIYNDDYHYSPQDGTTWSTLGNYGSSVFDGGEFTGTMLELFICDECLENNKHLVYLYKREKQSNYKILEVNKFSEIFNF